MTSPRSRRRPGPAVLTALLAVGAVLVGAGHARSSSLAGDVRAVAVDTAVLAPVTAPDRPSGDGGVPDAATLVDDRTAAVARLDPDLLDALGRATADAARDGVEVRVTSGWRSVAHQERLLREAVEEHGSREEAARWVATPETSAHVSGDAVDVGPASAARWLSRRGAAYGLCQVYDNEPWHFELFPGAVEDGCPARYADPTQDPRMQR